jgi:chromosome segregation ATPase
MVAGKSSIMGAVMVAFGAAPGKVRSKAKSLTEFIKRGTRTAQIKVFICNLGKASGSSLRP